MHELVNGRRAELPAELASAFASVCFTIAHLLTEVLRQWPLGGELLEHPERWLPEQEEAVRDELTIYLDDILGSIAVFVKDREESATDDEPFTLPVVSAAATRG